MHLCKYLHYNYFISQQPEQVIKTALLLINNQTHLKQMTERVISIQCDKMERQYYLRNNAKQTQGDSLFGS